MTLRILFLFAFTVINQIEAATNAKRVLIDNTIWTDDASKNPYNLTNDVQIPFNSTLTIQPGVIIDFGNGDFEILVKGFLRVEGTPEKPVIFQGGLVDNEKWMIKFQSTPLLRSSISHAHFIGPKKALQLVDVPDGIQENSGTLIIQSSTFSENATVGANGAYPRWANPSVPALLFQSCTFNQTTILSRGIDSEPISIHNSEIYNSTFYPRASNEGIQIQHSNLANIAINYDLSDSSNLVQLYNSTAKGIEIQIQAYSTAYQFIARQSTIRNLSLWHSYNAGSWSYLTNVIFEDSIISNVQFYSIFYNNYPYQIHYTVIIRNCLFNNGSLDFTYTYPAILVLVQNSQLHNVDIIQRIPFGSYDGANRKLVIVNSTFIDGSIIFDYGQSEISYSTIVLSKPPLSLNGNSVIRCSLINRSNSINQGNTTGISAVGLTLSSSTVKDFDIAIRTYPMYTYKVNITNTNFIGNTLYNIENQAIYDVYTQDVYWGTDNSSTVIEKLGDYWDDINYGIVNSFIYSLNVLAAETSCPPYGDNQDSGTTWASVTEI